MNIKQRVNHQDCSDQELVDIFRQLRDRAAVAELYERYRVSIGNYLYRDIKNKTSVTDTFNAIMLHLITKPSPHACGGKVSVRLFAMAYTHRLEYISGASNENTTQTTKASTQEKSTFVSKLSKLPRSHTDVIELVYKYNFSIEDVAEIISCSDSVVRNRLSYVRKQHQEFLSSSGTSQKATKGYIGQVKSTMPQPKRRRSINAASFL